ncbi:MAG TPA: sigma-70 family RNA polymerase sigma factor [Vicinamibacteria bacterium]
MSAAGDAPGVGNVTRLLRAWGEGDPEAPGELFTLLYDHLRRLARAQVRHGRDESLSATGLVHEAYLKLAGHERIQARDRGHFFTLAAKAMRQVLIDHARRRSAGKRGGGAPRETLDEGRLPVEMRAEELLALEQALERLEALDPRLARLVEVRFFAGLSVDETAEVLELSPRTVKRDWEKARAFLHRELSR